MIGKLVDFTNDIDASPSMDGASVSEALPLRSTAPEFTLPNASGVATSLRDFRGSPVVLVFYPLDWSPVSARQLAQYEEEKARFDSFGATVIGISVDSTYSHRAWARAEGLTFPLLSDFEPKGAAARYYRVYRGADGFSERALYVVDADGLIRFAHVAPQLDQIPDITDVIDAVREVTPQDAPQHERRLAGSELSVAEAAG
jgi:peroxiredoxin